MGRARKNRLLDHQTERFIRMKEQQTWRGLVDLVREVDASLHIEGLPRGRYDYALTLLSGTLGRLQALSNAMLRKEAQTIILTLEATQREV